MKLRLIHGHEVSKILDINLAGEICKLVLYLHKSQKHNILENMAAMLHNFKPYPSDRDMGMAAEAPVKAHPCLKEPGSVSGWYGWKKGLKFKMGNYRTKLARSGCVEVAVNAGRRSRNNPDKEHPPLKHEKSQKS